MTIKQHLLNLLKNPDFCNLPIDDPNTIIKRGQIIRQKEFLKKIYIEWYKQIASSLPEGNNPVLEIGSGSSFMSDYIKPLLRSDLQKLPDTDLVMDACSTFPFANNSLRGIAMINTLHHLPDGAAFFSEANRCLEPGGTIVMVEPWVSTWSSFIYKLVLHEPFDPNTPNWQFTTSGPLSGANGALPWIIFARDYQKFCQLYPALKIEKPTLQMPLRYLLSGGVSMRSLVPNCSFAFWQTLEKTLTPLNPKIAMFALIVIKKI